MNEVAEKIGYDEEDFDLNLIAALRCRRITGFPFDYSSIEGGITAAIEKAGELELMLAFDTDEDTDDSIVRAENFVHAGVIYEILHGTKGRIKLDLQGPRAAEGYLRESAKEDTEKFKQIAKAFQEAFKEAYIGGN